MSQPQIRAILRKPAVLEACGFGRATLDNRIKAGLFPRPISLGSRAVGWPVDEIAAINNARIAGWSNDQIRKLVSNLEKNRAAVTP